MVTVPSKGKFAPCAKGLALLFLLFFKSFDPTVGTVAPVSRVNIMGVPFTFTATLGDCPCLLAFSVGKAYSSLSKLVFRTTACTVFEEEQHTFE